mmetsp:Transcript_44216/g.84535  ORF Transcript_44216/g.84535 Transcript_44216/m.84535 type:complete len:226 (-) Transcript_44216:3267-3944(-)
MCITPVRFTRSNLLRHAGLIWTFSDITDVCHPCSMSRPLAQSLQSVLSVSSPSPGSQRGLATIMSTARPRSIGSSINHTAATSASRITTKTHARPSARSWRSATPRAAKRRAATACVAAPQRTTQPMVAARPSWLVGRRADRSTRRPRCAGRHSSVVCAVNTVPQPISSSINIFTTNRRSRRGGARHSPASPASPPSGSGSSAGNRWFSSQSGTHMLPTTSICMV